MQLPNKLYSYKNSTLSLIPIVLDEIKNDTVAVKVLYERVKPLLKDATIYLGYGLPVCADGGRSKR